MRIPRFLPVAVLSCSTLLLAFGPAAAAQPLECAICTVDMSRYEGPLKEEEVVGLLTALNDEYYAWVTYGRVIEDFGAVNPFVNIQLAEAQHIAALERLLREYKVRIPENPWVGKVPGSASLREACAAGAKWEIANHSLYERLSATTARKDILRVYHGLGQASQKNHLRAFERCEKRR
ncbi:MAG TPA: DUF2202 domain-containing protein [Thermoanaerobaculia bacterium]|nr:DUF2202 domain-containing protein [Thermoanaerobaculia bacterium]